jgi:hypothetical protein
MIPGQRLGPSSPRPRVGLAPEQQAATPAPHRTATSSRAPTRQHGLGSCVSPTSTEIRRAPSGELGMVVLLRSSASATTASPSSALLATTFRSRLLPRVSPPRRAFAASASAEPLEVCAKESVTAPSHLGDSERSRSSLYTLCCLVYVRSEMQGS